MSISDILNELPDHCFSDVTGLKNWCSKFDFPVEIDGVMITICDQSWGHLSLESSTRHAVYSIKFEGALNKNIRNWLDKTKYQDLKDLDSYDLVYIEMKESMEVVRVKHNFGGVMTYTPICSCKNKLEFYKEFMNRDPTLIQKILDVFAPLPAQQESGIGSSKRSPMIDEKTRFRIRASLPSATTSNPIAALTNFCKHQLKNELVFTAKEVWDLGDCEPSFLYKVWLKNVGLGQFQHARKKFAKEQAAKRALNLLNKDPEMLDELIDMFVLNE